MSGNSQLQLDNLLYTIRNNQALIELGVGGLEINDFQGFINELTWRPVEWVSLDFSDLGLQDSDSHMLSQLSNLKSLNISSNALESFDLSSLRSLKHLDLSHNELVSLDRGYELEELQYLNLLGNDQLECIELDNLEFSFFSSLTFIRPLNCQ